MPECSAKQARVPSAAVGDGQSRVSALGALRACTRCPQLVACRSQVVVGGGSPSATVLLVTGAPGAAEDALGSPIVGRAGRLLDEALLAAGFGPADVHVTGLVKCRTPDAREPAPAEVASCSEHLVAQVAAVEPVVVVALGGFVTKKLRGSPEPIRARRGREEPRRLGPLGVWLLPVFAPAAALYDEALVAQLHADLARLPELAARGRPEVDVPPVEVDPPPVPAAGQLGLF